MLIRRTLRIAGRGRPQETRSAGPSKGRTAAAAALPPARARKRVTGPILADGSCRAGETATDRTQRRSAGQGQDRSSGTTAREPPSEEGATSSARCDDGDNRHRNPPGVL